MTILLSILIPKLFIQYDFYIFCSFCPEKHLLTPRNLERGVFQEFSAQSVQLHQSL